MSNKENAEKALEILRQQYTAFADTVNGWDFFRGLAQYTKTVQEMMPTNSMVEALEKQRELAIKPYEILSKTASEELKKAGEDVIKIAKVINETSKTFSIMTDAISEVEAQIASVLSYSTDPLRCFNDNITEVATKIKSLGFSDAVKQFEDASMIDRDAYAFTFSPAYEKVDYEKKMLERRQETEAWGAWSELPIVEKVVLTPEEVNKEARKDLEYLKNRKGIRSYVIDELQDIRVQEMDLIRLGKKDAKDAVFFNITKYKDYAHRVHIYITTELIKTGTEQEFIFSGKQSVKLKNNKEPIKLDDSKKRKDIFLENDNLYYGAKKIPVERGQKSIVDLFLKNAKVYRGNKLTQKGTGIEIAELQKAGNYQNENAFRNALNKLRKKLKDSEFPATIENPQTKKYQLVIKYQ